MWRELLRVLHTTSSSEVMWCRESRRNVNIHAGTEEHAKGARVQWRILKSTYCLPLFFLLEVLKMKKSRGKGETLMPITTNTGKK